MELDQQQGLARFFIEPHQRPSGLERQLPARLIEQQPVNVLDGHRVQVEQSHGRLHRLGHGVEEEDGEPFLGRRWKWNEVKYRRGDAGQRSLAAADELG